MKSKAFRTTTGSAAALILIMSAYGLGYHRGSKARGPVIHFEPDTTDTVARNFGKNDYEPYFTKGSPIPALPR